jgi:hypothetical protein
MPSLYQVLSNYLANLCFTRSGLRERAVLSQDMTKSNRFWREVIHLFEFNWPYSAEMPYIYDASADMYRFTGAFENRVRDIRCWNMHTQFFKSFPDTFDDIVPASFTAPLFAQPSLSAMVQGVGTDADGDGHVASPASIPASIARSAQLVSCHWSSSLSKVAPEDEPVPTGTDENIRLDRPTLHSTGISRTLDPAFRHLLLPPWG